MDIPSPLINMECGVFMHTQQGECSFCGLEVTRSWIQGGYSEPCIVYVAFDEKLGVPVGGHHCPRCGNPFEESDSSCR